MPRLPHDVAEMLEAMKDPLQLDIDELANSVARCGQLNDLVLKNLNTGYYQINKKITSIREAVVYLGMHTVQNLIIFYITRLLFSEVAHKNKYRLFDVNLYWRHVIGTSVASSMLSARAQKGDRFKLFTYGLLHDIGIALLDACTPGLLDMAAEKVLTGLHQVIAERLVFGGITHADIGAWLCRKWNIREDITSIVEFHHTPFMAQNTTDEVKIVYVADIISTEYYEKLLGLNINHEISRQIMDHLGITDDDRLEIAEVLPQEVDKMHWLFTEWQPGR